MLALVLPSFARFCMAMKLGIAIAARMPMITTTIMSSMSVKPLFCLRRMAGYFLLVWVRGRERVRLAGNRNARARGGGGPDSMEGTALRHASGERRGRPSCATQDGGTPAVQSLAFYHRWTASFATVREPPGGHHRHRPAFSSSEAACSSAWTIGAPLWASALRSLSKIA